MALTALKSVGGQSAKNESQIAVVRALVETQVAIATEHAEGMTSGSLRDEALALVARALAPSDMTAALTRVSRIENAQRRSTTLRDIAPEMRRTDLEMAARIATRGADRPSVDAALRALGEALPGALLSATLELFRVWPAPSAAPLLTQDLLAVLANRLASQDPELALDISADLEQLARDRVLETVLAVLDQGAILPSQVSQSFSADLLIHRVLRLSSDAGIVWGAARVLCFSADSPGLRAGLEKAVEAACDW